jgi:hypothetical protein
MHVLNDVPVGRLNATVAALTPRDAEMQNIATWSLKHFQTQEDVPKQPRLAKALTHLMYCLGVHTAYAPNVVPASARIVDIGDLDVCINSGTELQLYRRQGLPADGVFLEPNEAFVMSGAGCPIIIATADNSFIVAHASRDSLIDRGAVTGNPTRNCISVVESVVNAFTEKGVPVSDISMCMLFAIPRDVFEHREDHPQYGEFNRALGMFIDSRWPGCVVRRNGSLFPDIGSVFVEQARQQEVRCAWAMHSLAEHPDLAHTRDGKGSDRRNLVIVKRNA